MRGTSKALLLALCLLRPLTVAAHGDTDKRIAALTHRIALDPYDARLFLARGRLLRVAGHAEAALRDFERAALRDPALGEVDYQRGVTLLDLARPALAKPHLDRYLARVPDDGAALAARARCLVALDGNLEAAADFTRAIALSPVPDYYLERARALSAAGGEHLGEAIDGLDRGLRRLGPVVSLQRLAINLDLARENFDGALARVARMSSVTRRPDLWLARRGDILARAGRREAAGEAYEKALAAIGKVSLRRRKTKTVVALESRLRAVLRQFGEAEGPRAGPR